jgi:hypothetical protein
MFETLCYVIPHHFTDVDTSHTMTTRAATGDITAVYNQIKEWVDENDLDEATIFYFAAYGIRIVQGLLADHDGLYKKDALMQALRLVVHDYWKADNENLKSVVMNLLESSVNSTIDLLIKVQKGEVDIGKAIAGCVVGCMGNLRPPARKVSL